MPKMYRPIKKKQGTTYNDRALKAQMKRLRVQTLKKTPYKKNK